MERRRIEILKIKRLKKEKLNVQRQKWKGRKRAEGQKATRRYPDRARTGVCGRSVGESAAGEAPTGPEALEKDGDVADKGRRSFLRRAEGQREYNAEDTVCQCLSNYTFE